MATALAVAFAGAASVLASGSAAANGRYPNASLIAFDKNDVDHLIASVTFGLLETRDGGKTFLWRCESALAAQAPQDVMVAITEDGTTVAAKFDGIVTTRDGCSFRSIPEVAGKNVVDLAQSRNNPRRLVSFHTGARDSGGFESQIMRSDDNGQSWQPLGSPLREDFLPLTIDVAANDESRIYLSGRLGSESDYGSVLLRSEDGGATFQVSNIPESSQHRLAYIAAVHPLNADIVYVRVNDPKGTRIWVTDDGGMTFRKLFTGNGQLLGFAVSPEGTWVALGGPADGVWIGMADGAAFARRSDVMPTCLAWNTTGLWACADQRVPPYFSLGLSRDAGATFAPLLRFSELCAVTGCPSMTSGASVCAADWELVAPAVGATCGTSLSRADAAAPDGGPLGGGISEATRGSCSFGRSPHASGLTSAGLLLVVILLARRRLLAVLVICSSCSANVTSKDLEVTSSAIIGGSLAGTCEWPSVVYVAPVQCSGTLIHPRVVMSAKHCVSTSPASVEFGERRGAFSKSVRISKCFSYQGDDFGFCVLAEEVKGVPIIPAMAPCEQSLLQKGGRIVEVGFGDESGSGPPATRRKKWINGTIVSAGPNLRAVKVTTGSQDGEYYGDSGGPAFFEMPDGTWRLIGNDYTSPDWRNTITPRVSEYSSVPFHLAWAEQQSGIDLTPCHDTKGNWEPGPECVGSPTTPGVAAGTWASLCGGQPLKIMPTCNGALDGGAAAMVDARPDQSPGDDGGEPSVDGAAGRPSKPMLPTPVSSDAAKDREPSSEPYTGDAGGEGAGTAVDVGGPVGPTNASHDSGTPAIMPLTGVTGGCAYDAQSDAREPRLAFGIVLLVARLARRRCRRARSPEESASSAGSRRA